MQQREGLCTEASLAGCVWGTRSRRIAEVNESMSFAFWVRLVAYIVLYFLYLGRKSITVCTPTIIDHHPWMDSSGAMRRLAQRRPLPAPKCHTADRRSHAPGSHQYSRGRTLQTMARSGPMKISQFLRSVRLDKKQEVYKSRLGRFTSTDSYRRTWLTTIRCRQSYLPPTQSQRQ